jgi:hypothetical protein
VVVPFLDRGYHPHRRRMDQWVSVLGENRYETTVLALAGESVQVSGVPVVALRHPRQSGGTLLAPKSPAVQRSIAARLGAALRTLRRGGTIHTVVALHPMLARTCGSSTDGRLIVDVQDASALRCVDPPHRATELVAVALSEDEARIVGATWPGAACHVVPLVPAGLREPRLTEPVRLSVWGRASTDSFHDLLSAFELLRRCGAGLHPRVAVLGEVGRSVRPSGRFDVVAPRPDLASALAGSIAFIPPPRCLSGVSARLLDAFAAGCVVLAGKGVARGTGCIPGVHYLQCDDAADLRRGLESIRHDRDRALRIAAAGQAWLRRHMERSRDAMVRLLAGSSSPPGRT